jgi:hypothetical protein
MFAFRFSDLCLINYIQYHEDICGSGGKAPAFMTSALGGSKWSSSRPNSFTPREPSPSTDCIEGSMVSRAGLDALKNRKISYPYRESNPDISVSSLAIPTELFHCWRCKIIYFTFIFRITVHVSLNCNPGVSGLTTRHSSFLYYPDVV